MASLAVRDLTVRFGAVLALDHVSFELQPGRVSGLIGPNGAGKTTVLDACTGFVPAGGQVQVDGRSMSGLPAHVRARRGLVRTFQSLDLLADLTVAENVASGMAARRGSATLRRLWHNERSTQDPIVEEALQLVGQSDAALALAGELSQGQRALTALARALAGDPQVLLLDEPAAGLDTVESARLGRVLTELVDRTGITCLLVEHDMGLVMKTCSELFVLDNGTLLAQGTPVDISKDPAVLNAYLGVSAPEPA